MMDQILMQFCDQKHNTWPYIVKQDHTGQDKNQNQYQKAPRPRAIFLIVCFYVGLSLCVFMSLFYYVCFFSFSLGSLIYCHVQFVACTFVTCFNKDQSINQSIKTKLDMTAKFGRITHNNGHFAVQGHSRSPILVPIESSYAASYIKTIARQVGLLRIKSLEFTNLLEIYTVGVARSLCRRLQL